MKMNGKKAKKVRKKVRMEMNRLGVGVDNFGRIYREVKNRIVKGTLTFIFSFIFSFMFSFVGLVYADYIDIPYKCNPIKVQKAFADKGYKVDLSGNDYTDDSFGLLENRGSSFRIITYNSATKADLGMIREIITGYEI
jgi:hypothetical protein